MHGATQLLPEYYTYNHVGIGALQYRSNVTYI
jgi:hypothetical protein